MIKENKQTISNYDRITDMQKFVVSYDAESDILGARIVDDLQIAEVEYIHESKYVITYDNEGNIIGFEVLDWSQREDKEDQIDRVFMLLVEWINKYLKKE